MRLRPVSKQWNDPGKYGPHVELFCFLLKKVPMVLSELIKFGPCISAETAKACAQIGLRMMAEENASRSDNDSCLDLGDLWRCGCPESLVWGNNGFEWAGNEGTFFLEYFEHNVGNLVVEVVVRIGQVK